MTVTAVDDTVIEGVHSGVITYQTSSADAGYNGLDLNDAVVEILDNELAQVAPLYVVPNKIITEADEGATADYLVVLSTAPTAQVTVNLIADSQISMASSLVFTTANWDVPQTVTMTAIDDAIGQGDRIGTVTYSVSSADARFNGTFVPRMALTIYDNEDFCGLGRPVYRAQDLNQDCVVDLSDFAEFAQGWMDCSHPYDTTNCICPCGWN